jgi:hypothetical protein
MVSGHPENDEGYHVTTRIIVSLFPVCFSLVPVRSSQFSQRHSHAIKDPSLLFMDTV